MIDLGALPPSVQATLLVGVVLGEAVAFYVGYGAVERLVAGPLIETIENA